MDLNKLADMADKVIEVSTTTVASISVPESQQQTSNSEIKQLREDITRLTELVTSLKVHPRQRSRSTSCHTSSPPLSINNLCPQIPFAGTIPNLERQLRNARSHAATPRPDISSNKCPGQCPSHLFFIKDLHIPASWSTQAPKLASFLPLRPLANIHQIN